MSQHANAEVSPQSTKKRTKKHTSASPSGKAAGDVLLKPSKNKHSNGLKPSKRGSQSSSTIKAARHQQKKQQPPPADAHDAQPAERDPLSQSPLQMHAAFFDHLVELVPARYYHDLDADRVNTKYMKKTDRLAAKAAFSKQHKQNKRDKLDPDKQQSTLEMQRQLAASSTLGRSAPSPVSAPEVQGDSGSKAAPAAETANGGTPPPAGTSHAAPRINLDTAPRSQLKERLAAKVAVLRDARNAEERAARMAAAKSFRETAGKGAAKSTKRSRDVSSGGRAAEGADSGNLRKGPKRKKLSDEAFRKQLAEVDQALSTGKKPPGSRPRPTDDTAVTELSFGQLAIGTAESQLSGRQRSKPRKDSKATLLAKAEANQAAIAAGEPRDSGPQGRMDSQAWGAAMKRARGEKVLDDPTRLRRSLKKDSKAADKRKSAWAQRSAEQTRSTSDRQKQREDNLNKRSAGKMERKKAKREKKLMRPGFEGRRSTSIGKNK